MKDLSPKLEFLATPHATVWGEFTAQPAFRAALYAALVQFTLDQGNAEGLENACRQDYETRGAKRFMRTLLNLAETGSAPAPLPNLNLKWQQPQPRQTAQPPPPSPAPNPPRRPRK